ncbi:hypothetical protein PHET_10827 [Paragonimus heterotremus]|uniref:ER membrane protein complex subunit 7 beta-sandwich domain-containing protein n=1 Tax=Paragonimus heterotremus TaxID=100268 RepID=A0A8J4SK25_9TREM|nr:hypothetical protein PHET_10827 [Paragonimus heterotremus]
MSTSTVVPVSTFSFLLILRIVHFVEANVIEGKLTPLPGAPADWYVHARIHVEGTEHVGFVKPDGSFEVHGLHSGSYVVEPLHPSFIFQTARVDINSKGRIRARRVNAPQPNAVKELPYPLRLTCSGKAVYFKVLFLLSLFPHCSSVNCRKYPSDVSLYGT